MSPIVFLFTLHVAAALDFSKYLYKVNDFKELSPPGVSPECVEDMAIFGASLANFTRTARLCVTQGGCTDGQKKLDSFGKLPPGILELSPASPGSYYECKDLVAPYQTHYCYADVVVENSTVVLFGHLAMKVAVCMPRTCSEQGSMNIPYKQMGCDEA
ncbi:hypothetical protein COOONC_26669 [Cooperia oncophora]